jgi:hypothetical protein
VKPAVWLVPVVLAAGCATRVFTPPVGPAVPFAEAPQVWEQVTASCRDAQRYVAQLRVQGWVGSRDQPVATTLDGAVTRSDDVYLYLQMLGATIFQMAGQAGQSAIVFPKDAVFLRAPTRDIVSALTGLPWGGRELLEVLTGCVAAPAGSVTGDTVGPSLRITLSPTTHAWLRERDGRWQLQAARIEGWLVEYRMFEGRWPSVVHVTAAAPTPLDLRFTVSQINVNIELQPTTFTATVPSHFQPITLDDLRSIGPLRDRGNVP